MNSYFQFKQFTVHQERTAMKIGTDGVLLGAWAGIENKSTLLDIGTGTGIIALMAAQRNIRMAIDAVEIDPEAYNQARENIAGSPWKDRINIYNTSIFDFYPDKKYDSIICNPPYFINSTQTPDASRTIARHCGDFRHEDLAGIAKRLLTDKGRLFIILPVVEAIHFIDYAQGWQLFPSRITHMVPTPGKAPKRYLMEFSKQPADTLTDELILELERHKYSEDYIRLTRDFYLYL